MPFSNRLLRFLALVARVLAGLSICTSLALHAADAPVPPVDTNDALEQLRKQIDAGQKALQDSSKLGDAELLNLRGKALAAQAQAADIADKLAPDITAMDARVAELGTPAPGTPEEADVASRRTQMTKARAALDGQVKLARLLGVESEQLATQIGDVRRSEFQARLGERTHSILAKAFWAELRDDVPRDRQRLAALGSDLATGARSTPLAVWAAMPFVLVAVGAAVWWAWRRVLSWLTWTSPSGRLRRSIRALVVVVTCTLAFGSAASALDAAFDGGDALSDAAGALLDQFVGMLWFSGYLYGLATALLSARHPSWRLPKIPDAVAESLRWFPLCITVVTLAARLAERLVVLVNASLSMTVAVNCFVALAMALTLTLSLMRAERVWRHERLKEGAAARPIWSIVVAVFNWLVLIVAVVSLLTGFVAFGSFAVKQVLWVGIVAGSAALLTTLVDDVLMAWLSPSASEPQAGAGEAAGAAPRAPKASAQIGVLASGVLRLALILLAVMLLLMPFGDGPADLLRQTGSWHPSLSIGQFKLEPFAVLQGLGVLLAGLGIVRLLRHWLSARYLPSTSLDASMRLSVTSLSGYAGVVVSIALAMSALGIGVERIAWVASALSVGIGFGLQAVVQNFVSGLIMLAERPVKVGDWVSLGGVEGDIRRINVRATEIQMGDRSTVIVPNSEFITKVVRNVTLADPIGLVALKLPVPITSNAEEVRALLLEAFESNESVLDDPAPSVLLDGIDNGALVFNASGFVDSPRNAYGVRSALLFDVLQRLQAAGIPLATPATMVLQGAEQGAEGKPPAPPSTPAPATSSPVDGRA